MTYQPSAKLAVICCSLAAVCLLDLSVASSETTSFHIGNSLTRDSELFAIPAFAEMRDLDHSIGFHTRSASSLTAILGDPNGETVSSAPLYGKFTTALPGNTWSAVTMQPYSGHTLEEEIDSALEFIDLTRSNPANSETVFYVYESWPNRINGSYEEQWLEPLTNLSNPRATRSRAFFDLFYDSLSAETDATLRTIPVGEVLYQFDVAAQQGEIPGYDSVSDLYRDHVHLSFAVGRYVASATTFATLFDETPVGLTKPEDFFLGDSFPLSQEFYEKVHKIIRDVLNQDSHTGVYFPYSDANGDGAVDADDLSLWEDSYPGPQFDVDQDGRIGALDFLSWQRQYNTQPIEFQDSPANLNGEGLVDSADIGIWEGAYQVDDAGDIDADGDSDAFDFLALQRELTPFDPADVNHDRRVDGADLGFWDASYGYSGLVDFDEDGRASALDFLMWQRETTLLETNVLVQAVATVPEPTSLLSCISLLLLHLLTARPPARERTPHRGVRNFKIARMDSQFD